MDEKMAVNPNGQLTLNRVAQKQLSSIKRRFNQVNNEIAKLVDEQEINFQKAKELKSKKKELTQKLDAELKELKIRNKQIAEEKIMLLGKRITHQDLIKEFLKDIETPEESLMEKSFSKTMSYIGD